MDSEEPEACARRLEAHEDYLVLRRLARIDRYHDEDPALRDADEIRQGVFLDVETTGLDASIDKVIELALVPFEFAPDGRIFALGEEYDGFNDPGMPISPEITRLTGIDDQMVAGKTLDLDRIVGLLEPAHLVIAHNAGFDRPFAEEIHPLFAQRAWGCSLADVPWRDEGLESAKLDYLAFRFGFFFAAHRATVDCRAGIHLLTQTLPESGSRALDLLLQNARRKTVRLWAEGSPFEARARLKDRQYRWNSGDDGRPKSWYRDLDETELDAELAFLREEVFGGRLPALETQTINAFNRYSARV